MLSLTACSSGEQVSSSILNNRRTKYDLTDNAGKFKVEREVFYQKKNNDFIIKRKVFSKSKKSTNILEKSITISKLGKVKKLPLLRPSVSQYSVWFDGKKYFSEMKVDVKKKAIVLRMKSPEKQWNGQKTIKFPKGNGVFCFYSQVAECASVTGFVKKAVEKGAGKMRFYILWDGYPYFQEQYLNLPTEIFTPAIFQYDGKNRKQEIRFTLKAGGQSIFYFLKKNGSFSKKFWVSQGFSMVESDIQ
ncbi:MAG: hypothetical protein HN509_04995 [Halobacteriovoraceae bacterium]|nr:hypothetical protein [Halobacteriovoraceae bacterium]